jgi:hypothetical protein
MKKNFMKNNSADESGMIMVECLVCLTMFAIFMMTLIYMADAVIVQTKLQTALDKAAKEISVYGYVESNNSAGAAGAYSISNRNNLLYEGSAENYSSEVNPVVNAFVYGNSWSGVARVICKYLEENGDITYLSGLGVEGGYNGLDFSGCSYDVNNDDLTLQVSYNINVFRFNLFSGIGGAKKVVLTSSTKFWKE